MKKSDISKAPAVFRDYVQSLGQDPVILMVGRRPIGVWLPVEDADLETVSLSFNPKFLEILRNSERSYFEKGGISDEELRRRLGIPPFVEPTQARANGQTKAKRHRKKVPH